MSKIYYNDFKTPYDMEQAFQRHMTYLKTKQRTSTTLQKQVLNNELGLNQVTPMPKTSAEILDDEQEVNKLVQSYLVSFFIDNPNLQRNINETDAQYENRKYPSRYVFNKLSQEDKKIILQQYPAIKTQLREVAILTPEYFLNFIRNYKDALQRSGGVKGFSSSITINMDEIKAILMNIPKKEDFGKLYSLVRDIKTDTDNIDAELSDLFEILMDKLLKMEKNIPTNKQLMNLQTAIELKIDNGKDQSRIDELIENIEKIPTKDDILTLGRFLFKAIDDNSNIDELKEILNNVLSNIGVSDKILMNIQQEMNNISSQVSSTEQTLNDLAIKTNIRIKDGLVNKIYKEMIDEYVDNYNKTSTSEKLIGARNVPKDIQKEYKNRALIQALKISQESENNETIFNNFQNEQIPIAYSELTYPQVDYSQYDYLKPPTATAENIDETGKGMIANRVKNKIQPKYITKSKMVGKGISVNETPKYIEFGKYCLSIPHLNNGILKVKYQKTMVDVPNLKNNISVDFIDFIENFIDTQKINDRQLEKLSKEEQKLFKKLINKSGLDVKYKVKDYKDENDVKEEDRFNLVKGQYMAGNDNPRIKEELRKFIIKFMMEGKINKKEGQDILFQLSM